MDLFSEDEKKELIEVFNGLDEEGVGELQTSDIDIALELVGCKQKPHKVFKIISEIDPYNTGVININTFAKLVYSIRYAGLNDDNQDMIDAFVAVGGNEDTSGKVDADKLIEIIKKEFELTIDIEGLIKEIDADGSGEIEFNEFFDLLKTDLSEGKDNYDLE